MSVKIFKIDTLKIKLAIDDLKIYKSDDKLKGNNIDFKPSMIDKELGKELYFTRDFLLSPTNLSKAGFDNNAKTHRQVLSSKSKMQEFLTYMDNNKEKTEEEKETNKKTKLEDINKNLEKERTQYEHTQIIDKLKEEFSDIKNELTKKGFKSANSNEKTKYNDDKQQVNNMVEKLNMLKKTVSSNDFKKEDLINVFDICINLKEKYSINDDTLDFFKKLKKLYNTDTSLITLHEATEALSDADKYLINKDLNNKIKKNKEEIKEIKVDNKNSNEQIYLHDDKNVNFIKDTFFKSNEKIDISPNSFVIYSSACADCTLNPYTKTKQETTIEDIEKREEKQKISGTTYQITINIKLIDSKEKLSKVEYAKIGCSERAKRIEKEAFELFGISFNLLQNTNMYNPLAVYEKITRTDEERKKEERIKKREKEKNRILQEEAKEDAVKAEVRIKKRLREQDKEDEEDNPVNGGAIKRRTKRRTKR